MTTTSPSTPSTPSSSPRSSSSSSNASTSSTSPRLPARHRGAYDLDDLRADTARLIHRLHSSPAAPADDAAPVTVEVDHGSASTRGQPPGRTWLIRLRCADRSVVVAVGLSQTAADHLAQHITDVISPRHRNR